MADEEYDFDPWEGSSGLPDQITVRVDTPKFGFDAQLQDGKACAFFLEGIVLAGGDEPGAEFSQWYTVGKNWEPASKGARLVPEDGKKRKLNTQTNYYHLFNSLLLAARKQDLEEALRKRGNPFQADMWSGLELYLEREEFTRTIQGETQEGSRLLVSRIEKMPGTGSRFRSAPPEAGTPATTTAGDTVQVGDTPPAVTDTAVEGGGGADLSPLLKVSLRRLAEKVKAEGGSHSQFAEMAFSEIAGVLDNPVAEDAVMDQGTGSIWATATP